MELFEFQLVIFEAHDVAPREISRQRVAGLRGQEVNRVSVIGDAVRAECDAVRSVLDLVIGVPLMA